MTLKNVVTANGDSPIHFLNRLAGYCKKNQAFPQCDIELSPFK